METEKRKRNLRRIKRTHVYLVLAILLLFGTCISGYMVGVELNDDELQSMQNDITLTANEKATRNPAIMVTQTTSAIETQWAEINITQTVIAD